MGDKFSRKKKDRSRTVRMYYVIGGSVFIFLIMLFLFSLLKIEILSQVPFMCGDGTFDGSCSLNKPYFCRESRVVSDPAMWGCSNSYELKFGECVSAYTTSLEDIKLNILVGGIKKSFLFRSYPKVLEYLLELPRAKYYGIEEVPRRDDFKLIKIDESVQRDFLMPLIASIQNAAPNSKDLQARVAISIVQNIPYGEPEFMNVSGTSFEMRLSRYPYQVIAENMGSCEGKSELLAFLLRELGFGVALFYYPVENHEAIGIKCPMEYSLDNTGYCFVETTMPSPISYSEGRYLGPGGNGKLRSEPQIVLISEGIELGGGLDDYGDADELSELVDKIDEEGVLNYFEKKNMDELREKYGLLY